MIDLNAPAPSGIAAARASCSQRGIVLPVVLVMLLMMTVVVIFLMRRGTVDERIAFNVRQVTTLDTAAQFALRTCERNLWCAPPGVNSADYCDSSIPSPNPVPAPANTATAAWRVNANWTNNQRNLGSNAAEITALFGAGVTAARCLFEEAQAELDILNDSPSGTASALLPDDEWRKYRITAEVIGTDGSTGRAQTEVRFAIR